MAQLTFADPASSALTIGDIRYNPADDALSVIAANGPLTVASAITPPAFSTINAHGIQYKTQKFEDRPTVFGSPLRIQWRVDDLELLRIDDSHDFALKLVEQNAKTLKMAIARDCPDCLECPKCDIKVQRNQDDLRHATHFIMQASCKSERNTAHMTMCPNGKAAVLKGSTALVPDTSVAPEIKFTDVPATEVRRQEPQPYISPQTPDKPMASSPDAW